jgi:hypothetical protein
MGHVLHVLSADVLSFRQIVVTIYGTSPVLSVTYPKVTLSRSWNSPRRQALAPEPHMLWKVGGTPMPTGRHQLQPTQHVSQRSIGEVGASRSSGHRLFGASVGSGIQPADILVMYLRCYGSLSAFPPRLSQRADCGKQ